MTWIEARKEDTLPVQSSTQALSSVDWHFLETTLALYSATCSLTWYQVLWDENSDTTPSWLKLLLVSWID
jgi:hypothetical protein